MKPREKKLAVATGAAIVLFLAHQVFLSPFLQRWRELRARANGLEAELAKHHIALRQKEAIEKLYDEVQEDIRQEGTDEEEIAGLLQDISALSRRHSLSDQGVEVLPAEAGGFYRKFRIKLALEGRALSVADFLHGVITARRPLRIEHLSVRAVAGQYEVVRAAVLVSAVFAAPHGAGEE